MKFCFRTMIVMTLALGLFGCAGLSKKKTGPVPQPLPDMVPESFHFNLQDANTRRYLDSVDPDSIPPDLRLEVLVLRELAAVSAEEELGKAFDRLWEEQSEIKALVGRPERREGNTRPLVEIYYLLSSGSASSWQAETAERLYRETLSRFEPSQLSGYALHFYTLALLKNRKLDAALPFLFRLEHFTEPQIYLEDLTVALTHAMAGGADQLACELLATMCCVVMEDNSEFPEKEVEAAIMSLKQTGKLELLRKALVPVIREHSELERYAFVQLLKQSQDTTPEKQQITPPVTVAAAERNRAPESALSGIQTRKVRIEVQAIKAGQQSSEIDPALRDIVESLKKNLNFSNFSLVSRKIFQLGIGEKGDMSLPNSRLLQVIPRSLTPEICRVEVRIFEKGREVFHTLVESVDKGTATIGGPQVGNEILLLRITTFLMYSKDDGQFVASWTRRPDGIPIEPIDFSPEM